LTPTNTDWLKPSDVIKRPSVNYLAVPNMKVVQTWFEASEDGILWVFQISYFAVAKARFLP
jgi:hypothetical protein